MLARGIASAALAEAGYQTESKRRRLAKAVEHSFRHLGGVRQLRQRLVRHYAGDFYGVSQASPVKTRQYANLLQLTAEAYTVNYAYSIPRFLVTTHVKQHQAFARRFQEGLNGLTAQIEFGETLKAIVLDAFFYFGCAKVYLADSAAVAADADPWMIPTMPFVGRVSPDDLVFDVGAKEFRQCGYIGDRYRMTYDDAKKSPRFEADARRRIKTANALSNKKDESLTSEISKAEFSEHCGEYEEMVDLCDLYLPRERKILTYQVDSVFAIQDYDKPLAVYDWEGSETGPYEMLALQEVPDNVLPTSIAANIFGLHTLFNNLMLKLANRARRQKQFLTYADDGDARKIRDVEDGGMIQVQSPEAVKDVSLGGVDGPLAGFAMQVAELYKQHAGNPDMMLGLGPASGTATQDLLINQQANKREAAIRQKISKFISNVGKQLAELMWDDPLLTVPGEQPIEGTGFVVDASWYPASALPRQGTFADYQCKIEPYPSGFKTPGQRSQEISAIIAELMPFIPGMAQQGKQFNVEKLLELKGEYHDLPELMGLFEAGPLPQDDAAAPPEAGAMRSNQPREYIRRSVSDGGMTGKQSALTQLLSNAGADE